MSVVAGSLFCRLTLRAWHWLRPLARESLIGRFFLALAGVLGPVFAGSRVFGLEHTGCWRLGSGDLSCGPSPEPAPHQSRGCPPHQSRGQTREQSWTVSAIARLYQRLCDWIARTRLGGAVRLAGPAIAASAMGNGGWTYVVGAGLLALGCGRLGFLLASGVVTVGDRSTGDLGPWLRLAVSVTVLLAGIVLLVSGPRLQAAWPHSAVGRILGRGGSHAGVAVPSYASTRACAQGPRPAVIVLVAAFLAASAGLVSGLTPGSSAVLTLALALAISVFALLLARPEAMLVVFAAFPWLDWLARRSLGSLGAAWDEGLLLFSLLLLAWGLLVLRRGDLWTIPMALPVLLALAAAVGSITVNQVPADVAWFSLRVLFQPLLFYFLGFLFPKTMRWTKAAVVVFLLGGAALALHGLYQYVTHAPMPARWVDIHETYIGTRAYSIVGNPNGLGAFLIMGALVSLGLALASRLSWRVRLLAGVSCAVHLAGVAVTFSRGAWIGLGLGGLALLIMAYRRYLAPLAAAGILAWFFAPQAFVKRLTFAFSSAYLTKSMEAGRLLVWRMALERMYSQPLFGVGLGTFGGTSAVTFGYGRLWVDNFYLQLGAEGGLPLLFFFLWMLLRAAKALVRGHGTVSDPYLRALCAGVFGAFVAVSVANLFASVWETLVVGAGFWFLAGLATSAAFQITPGPKSEEQAGRAIGSQAER